MTITEFLEARIAEDEAVARAAQQGQWYMGKHPDYGFDEGIWVDTGDVHEIVCIRDVGWNVLTNDVMVVGEHVVPLVPSKDWQDGPHIARHDPARVLAECAAKRAILTEHEETMTHWWPEMVEVQVCARCGDGVTVEWPCPTIRALAAVYASHPDYDPGWA